MKSINSKLLLATSLIALLGLGLILGNGGLPFIPTVSAQTATNAVESALTNAPAEKAAAEQPPTRRNVSDRVKIGGSQKLLADDETRDLVTVFGSSDAAGTVLHDMVTVLGGAKMTGKAGHDMVTVFGNVEVNGPVNHDLVVVFGSLKLGPNAKVGHDCVAVFGKIDRDPKAVLTHEPVEVMPWFSSLGDYIRTGPLMGRPLPPGSGLAWIVVGFYFLLYLLVAVILPKPTAACVRQLDHRPLLSFGVGILIMILLAPLYFILAVTGVGVFLIPFIGLAEAAFIILGKTATLEFIGLQLRRRFSPVAEDSPGFAFLMGFILVTLIYMVPVLGGLLWLALRPVALGAAVMSLFGKMNGNGNPPPAPGIQVQTAAPLATSVISPVPPVVAGTDAGGATQSSPVTPSAPPSGVAAAAETTLMPRAGFWIRLAATALDFILLVWLIPFVHVFFPFIWVAYHVGMWAWKGTTVGGIVCRLKLVRVDGRPVDFAVALVRGLASVFSAVALFLGFFWAGWTRERQSWHDLIAGTVVVRVPEAVSLI
jgi:uncharacterized RDD family membrane protein YckC